GIAAGADRTVGRLPDRELLARAGATAEHRLELALLPYADAWLPRDLLLGRHVVAHRPGYGVHERVRVGVDVGDLVVPEIDRVRVEDPRAPEEVRMVHLQGESFPAAGGAPGEQAGPGRADHAEVLFQVRNELPQDRVAVGPIVRRVHRVGVVEVGRRVLERDGDEAREGGGAPRLVELEAGLAGRARQPGLPLLRRFGARVGRE